jgi:glycosyltransferase involved in cell wall biosynthesis
MVRQAVGSVLSQTRAVSEIIVVDDGSTDDTCDALQGEFGGRVRYVRKENGGVSSARNLGLSLARGRYLALLDSDDRWLPGKHARQMEWLESHEDFGMVLCDVRRSGPAMPVPDIFRRRTQLPQDGFALASILLQPALAPSSVLMRREVYADIGGFDESLVTAEDIDYHLRIASRWKIGVVEELLVDYRVADDTLSSLERTYGDYVKVIERVVAESRAQVGDELCNRALALAYERNARWLIRDRRWRDAWSMGRRSLQLRPFALGQLRVVGLLPLAVRCFVAQIAAAH